MIQGGADFLKEQGCRDGDKPILQPRCPKLRGITKRIQERGNPNVGVEKDVHPALALVGLSGSEGDVLLDLAGAKTPGTSVNFSQKGAERLLPLAYRGDQHRNQLFLQERKRLLEFQHPMIVLRPH